MSSWLEERWKMEAAAKQEKGSEEVNLGIGKKMGREPGMEDYLSHWAARGESKEREVSRAE